MDIGTTIVYTVGIISGAAFSAWFFYLISKDR